MRRLARALLAALALVTAGAIAPPAADAHVNVCALTGVMEIFGRLGQYPIHENEVLDFEMHLVPEGGGGCVASDDWTMTGTIYGACTSAVVFANTGDGHRGEGYWTGTQWTLTGTITATLNVYEIPLYPLCISGAAWAFEVTGPVSLTHLT